MIPSHAGISGYSNMLLNTARELKQDRSRESDFTTGSQWYDEINSCYIKPTQSVESRCLDSLTMEHSGSHQESHVIHTITGDKENRLSWKCQISPDL